jgi:hypothetical protein
LGYLNDVIIVPAGIHLVRQRIPPVLFDEHRAMADRAAERSTSRTAAVLIHLARRIGVGDLARLAATRTAVGRVVA